VQVVDVVACQSAAAASQVAQRGWQQQRRGLWNYHCYLYSALLELPIPLQLLPALLIVALVSIKFINSYPFCNLQINIKLKFKRKNVCDYILILKHLKQT
jgi:hypothetical protein